MIRTSAAGVLEMVFLFKSCRTLGCSEYKPRMQHFLFKTGTGTTPLFSTATPGYTMATGSVYSPPTRPLPRNTLSRSAFKFKKSSKYCSWR
ncbi:hypothetical protein PAMP_020383 [Pampus punctatissimus]